MNISSLQQKGTWIFRRGCQMLELGAIVSRMSPPVICLSQPQTYSPILASPLLAQDSGNCLSPLPVDLVSQSGASEAKGRRETGEGTFCLFTVPVIVMAPTAVFCSVPVAGAVCSRFQLLSKLASSNWLLPSLETCVLSLRSPFAKLLALTKASPSATSLLPCL